MMNGPSIHEQNCALTHMTLNRTNRQLLVYELISFVFNIFFKYPFNKA